MIYDCKACNNYSASGVPDFVQEGAREHRKVCPARIEFRTGKVPEGYYVHRMPNGKRTYFQIPGYVPKAERFTGFDGIPDWTEKDSEIANLKKELKQLQDDFYHVQGVRDRALDRLNRLETAINSCIQNGQFWLSRGCIATPIWDAIQAFKILLTI
jgi:hypothetical protein